MLSITYLTLFYFHFVLLFKEKLLLLSYCLSYYIKKVGVNKGEVPPMSTQKLLICGLACGACLNGGGGTERSHCGVGLG